MLKSNTGHARLLHQALYHATLRSCCNIKQRHGMPCEMGTVSGACDHLQHTLQDPSLYLKKDVERFLWNFLALRTSSGQAAAAQGMKSARCSTLNVYCYA